MHTESLFSLPISNPVALFGLAMVIILVAPLLAVRLRLPGIVGVLLAGLIVSPNALNLMARDETIVLLGTVGLLYIMFQAGLEVNMIEFSRHRRQSLQFGITTFLLPLVIGTAIGLYLIELGWGASILLGSLFASHTLLAYPAVSRLGLAAEASVTTTVGGTILTDTLALLVLAITANSVGDEPTGWQFWLLLVGKIAIYSVAVFTLLPRIGRWFFRHYPISEYEPFVFILAAVFVTAFFAEVAGIEPIIGAFVAGLILNRLVPHQSTLMNRIQFVGESLFIPFFMLSVGMLIDLRVLFGGWDAWIVAGSMIGAVMLSKWMAAQLARPLFGYSRAQAGLMYGLTIPQAAATLAAALVGFEIGLFNENILNGTILMMLVTCVIGPLLADYYGRRLVLELDGQSGSSGRQPLQRILIPLANTASIDEQMELAQAIYDPQQEQPLLPLVIVRSGNNSEQEMSRGERRLELAVTRAAAANIPARALTRLDYQIGKGIVQAVREERASLVVMHWAGDIAARQHLLGTIADEVVKQTTGGVLLQRTPLPLVTSRRLIVMLPPLLRLEEDLLTAGRHLMHFGRQYNVPLVFVGLKPELKSVREQFSGLAKGVELEYIEWPEWKQTIPRLEALVLDNDMVILLSPRPGTIAWRPSLAKLPRLLATRFADHNLLIYYLALPVSFNQLTSEKLAELPAVRTYDIQSEKGMSLPRVLEQALYSLDDFDAASVNYLLDQMIQDDSYSPELRPGQLLYLARDPQLKEPVLLFARSQEGVMTPRASQPAHQLFLLLLPERTTSSASLRLIEATVRYAGLQINEKPESGEPLHQGVVPTPTEA